MPKSAWAHACESVNTARLLKVVFLIYYNINKGSAIDKSGVRVAQVVFFKWLLLMVTKGWIVCLIRLCSSKREFGWKFLHTNVIVETQKTMTRA